MLLDTHVLLWWKADSDRLSARVRQEIADSRRLLVSPVSFWEISMLVSTGRVMIDRSLQDWVRDLVQEAPVQVAPLSPTAAVVAGSLGAEGFSGDPADAMLYSTARDHAVPFATKDQRIRSFATARRDVEVIW